MRDAVGNGLTIRPLRAMINHATTEVFFDNMEVPAENLIGFEDAVRGLSHKIDQIAASGQAAQTLALELGKFNITANYVCPGAIYTGMTRNNFDNPEIRKAMLLALDRKSFIDILNQGQAQVGGSMEPLPDGVWGLPPNLLHAIPGYGPDAEKNRNEARALMEKAGYGPNNRLKLKIATRGISLYKGPAVILAGQLKEIYVDADVDIIETAQWYPKVARKDYQVGLNTTGNGVDDPDQNYYENFSCKSERNYTGYCNPEIEKLFDVQSQETDLEKRKKVVWEIDSKLLEDGARPIVMWNRASICMQPYVKGYVANVNSVYNGFRFEDVWIDK